MKRNLMTNLSYSYWKIRLTCLWRNSSCWEEQMFEGSDSRWEYSIKRRHLFSDEVTLTWGVWHLWFCGFLARTWTWTWSRGLRRYWRAGDVIVLCHKWTNYLFRSLGCGIESEWNVPLMLEDKWWPRGNRSHGMEKTAQQSPFRWSSTTYEG